MQHLKKQHAVVNSANLGIAAAALNVSHDSEWVDVRGINHITIELDYTNSDGTGVKFSIQQGDRTTGRYLLDEEQSGSGVRTCYTREYQIPSSVTGAWALPVEVDAEYLRIKDLIDINAAAAASNTATMRIIKGMV